MIGYRVRSEPRQIVQPRDKSVVHYGEMQSSPNSVFGMAMLEHSASHSTFGSHSSTNLSDSIATQTLQKAPMQELANECAALIDQIDHARDIHGITLDHPVLRDALVERKSVLARANDPQRYRSYMNNTRIELSRAKSGLYNVTKGAQTHATRVKSRASRLYGTLNFSAQRARSDSPIDKNRLYSVIGGNRDLTRDATKTDKFFAAMHAVHAANREAEFNDAIRKLQGALTAKNCGSVSEFLLPKTVAQAISPAILEAHAASSRQTLHAEQLIRSITQQPDGGKDECGYRSGDNAAAAT